MSREYTEEEVRERFLGQVRAYVAYWARQEGTVTARLEGLAFSMLVILDGGTDLPGFIVAPQPHHEDRAYHQANGENWYPENNEPTVKCDIAGSLHELFHRPGARVQGHAREPERVPKPERPCIADRCDTCGCRRCADAHGVDG